MHIGNDIRTSSGKEAMAKVTVILNVGQTPWSRSLCQKFWYPYMVLSQGIHMLTMKALPIVVHDCRQG